MIKEKLNKVTHSVRISQAVLSYGVGAMVDFPDQTLVTAAPEMWSKKEPIYDDRFAKFLGVKHFAMPIKIAYSRFPEWYFCPKCRKFQPIDKWIEEYGKLDKKTKYEENDPYMVRHMKCPMCKQELVVSRIVTVCKHGHLNDFPWVEWVHTKNVSGKKPICNKPSLKFTTGASSSEGLEGLTVECSSCKARATLKGAFEMNIFKQMDFKCEGHHPFKHKKETCEEYPRAMQRGASSVYFPLTMSSLVIPPYANKLNRQIEESEEFKYCVKQIDDEDTDEEKRDLIKRKFDKWVDKIANGIGKNTDDVKKILADKWLSNNSSNVNTSETDYRYEEYRALTGEISGAKDSDFVRVPMSIEEYNIPHVKSVALIEKARVVNALIGFSRIIPASSKGKGLVYVKERKTPWYPAYETRGEGIFLEIDPKDIEKWTNYHPEIIERAQILQKHYDESFIGQNHLRVITPKFILLHTLSHLLIKALSFECGYSIASLRERLYYSDEPTDKQMTGIFIYTASGDSEGTLGGLVRQGYPDTFPKIFRKAVNSALRCSNDPICITNKGQGRDALNLAACHACALLPETCCEERNAFLDRGMIVGTFENKKMGFYSDAYA